MPEEFQMPPITRESRRLALLIACLIWVGRDEKEVIHDICAALRMQNINIHPEELGRDADYMDEPGSMCQEEPT